jgi:hypothetical protein
VQNLHLLQQHFYNTAQKVPLIEESGNCCRAPCWLLQSRVLAGPAANKKKLA